jgi:hypothetical protein
MSYLLGSVAAVFVAILPYGCRRQMVHAVVKIVKIQR